MTWHNKRVVGTAAHLHKDFFVVTAVSNFQRFRTRYELYNNFADHMRASGAQLYTIELALGNREWALADPDGDDKAGTILRLRTDHELWQKETLLNRVIEQLPSSWKYVAWIDADVHFVRPDWVNETIQQLQHYDVVQMWSEAHDLGPNFDVLAQHESFVASYMAGRPRQKLGQQNYGSGGVVPGKRYHWHPGFAWAARRTALDHVGRLIDFAPLGAGDNHMAHGLIGQIDDSVHPEASSGYRRALRRWQFRAETHLRRNIGVVPGTLLHYWHGKKVDRKYWDRWRILIDNKFDPDKDLKRDVNGLFQLQDNGDERYIGLRDGIRNYFRQRNEDSIDVE